MTHRPATADHHYPHSGYTLFEMSLVIVIISLIIGGIMIGQALIREAQIRAMIGEYSAYLKAFQEFQSKYQALPGDFGGNGTAGYSSAALATAQWGADAGCPNTPYNTVPKTATCDGDANGHIGDSTSTAALTNSQEWWRAWQQLSDAGFLQIAVTGAQGPNSPNEAVIGLNVPASQVGGAGWTITYYLFPNDGINTNAGKPLWMDQYGHILHFGGYKFGDVTNNPILLTTEAAEIDNKLDDGLPGTGTIRAWRNVALPNCITGDGDANQTTAAYNTAYTGANACSLIFITGF